MVFALEDPVGDEEIVISAEQETPVEAKRNPLVKSSLLHQTTRKMYSDNQEKPQIIRLFRDKN